MLDVPEVSALQMLYKGHNAVTATADEDALAALLLEIARRIFNGEDVKADPALYALLDEQLQRALGIGLGDAFPDNEFRAKLASNVSQFSAGKSVWEVVAINRLLSDPASGKLREWVVFREEVLKLHALANVDWLRTEYDTAQGRAQGAAAWQRAWADREAVPYLEYRTVGDDRVRPAHQQMNGVSLPVEHPFWRVHYPPNGWNCRCLVEQVPEVPEDGPTEESRLSLITPPTPLFRDNPGITGNIFDPAHPYFNYLPQAQLL